MWSHNLQSMMLAWIFLLKILLHHSLYSNSKRLYSSYKWLNMLIECFRIWGSINMTAFNVVIFLMIISHLQAVLSDPGTVPLPKTSLDFSDLHAGQKPKVSGHSWTQWTVRHCRAILLMNNPACSSTRFNTLLKVQTITNNLKWNRFIWYTLRCMSL